MLLTPWVAIDLVFLPCFFFKYVWQEESGEGDIDVEEADQEAEGNEAEEEEEQVETAAEEEQAAPAQENGDNTGKKIEVVKGWWWALIRIQTLCLHLDEAQSRTSWIRKLV